MIANLCKISPGCGLLFFCSAGFLDCSIPAHQHIVRIMLRVVPDEHALNLEDCPVWGRHERLILRSDVIGRIVFGEISVLSACAKPYRQHGSDAPQCEPHTKRVPNMDDRPSHTRMPPGNWANIARSPRLYRQRGGRRFTTSGKVNGNATAETGTWFG